MESHRLDTARRRQAWLYLFFFLFGVRLAWALVDVQVLSHADWVESAQRQQKKRVEIAPERGRVFDRNGIPLATNRESHEIYVVPRHVEDVDAFVERFTAVVPYDQARLRAAVARGGWYVRLLRGVDRETVRRLEAAAIDGVGVETYHVRHYPNGAVAASLLGRVDTDNVGIEGVELQYDSALRGKPGWAIHQRDALGRQYPNFTYPVEAPVHGQDVWLTIDLELQEIVESALDGAMERTRAQSGSVVVVDPSTGEVLALADRDAPGVGGPPRNHAVVDQFEPGSTFKIVPLTGLYEERLAAPTDSLFCENGSWNWNGRTLTDVHPYGMLSIEEVIEESSNICSAKLAARLGDERIYEYGRRFGFGLPTGLDFPGEPRGLFKRPDAWSAMTSASIAMGYEVMVTSIQMAMAYAAIANEGELMRPWLVRKVVSPEGATRYEGRPQRVRRVMTPETARLVTQALVRVVEGGTAQNAQIDMLPVAGKTGTAKKTGAGGYARGRYTSSFAGFFPAVGARYVVFVRIDEPVGAFYGGAVAAPVFREAMEGGLLTETLTEAPSLVGRMREPDRVLWRVSESYDAPLARPDTAAPTRAGATAPAAAPEPEPEPLDGPEAPWIIEVGADGPGPAARFDPITQVKVPDFSGLALREAVGRAGALGLRLAFDGTGRIVAQEPEPGEVLPRGGLVRVRNP